MLVFRDGFPEDLLMPLTTDLLRRKCQYALTRRGREQFGKHWVTDWITDQTFERLQKRGLFASQSWKELPFADEIVREAEVYLKLKQRVAEINVAYANAEELLTQAETILAGNAREFRKLPSPTGEILSSVF